MSGWLPIASAPQDGQSILGLCRKSRHVETDKPLIVFWYAGHPPEDCDQGCEPCWCAAGPVHYVVEPSHWMPLPEVTQ